MQHPNIAGIPSPTNAYSGVPSPSSKQYIFHIDLKCPIKLIHNCHAYLDAFGWGAARFFLMLFLSYLHHYYTGLILQLL